MGYFTERMVSYIVFGLCISTRSAVLSGLTQGCQKPSLETIKHRRRNFWKRFLLLKIIQHELLVQGPGLSTNCHACPFLSKLSDQTESMQSFPGMEDTYLLPSHIVIHRHLHRDTWRKIPHSCGTAFWMFRMRFPSLRVLDLHRISCGRQLPQARWQGNRLCLGRDGFVNFWKLLELVSIYRFVWWKSVILPLTESHVLNSWFCRLTTTFWNIHVKNNWHSEVMRNTRKI